jgi:hypothetical protein
MTEQPIEHEPTEAGIASSAACRWCGLADAPAGTRLKTSRRTGTTDLWDLACEMKRFHMIRWVVEGANADAIRSAAEAALRLADCEVNAHSLGEYLDGLENEAVGDWTDSLVMLQEAFNELRAQLHDDYGAAAGQDATERGEKGPGESCH